MSLPSFSSLERAEACPASHALPRVLTTGEYAECGKSIHDFLRLVTDDRDARDRALARIVDPDTKKRCASIDLREAFEHIIEAKAEPAFAIDIETRAVRLIGFDVNREYGERGPNEIVGALDVAGKHEIAKIPIVNDWKTGFGEVTPPDENLQIGSHAFVLSKYFESDDVLGRISFLDEDGAVTPVEHAFNALALERVFERMSNAVRRVREAEARFAAGELLTVNAGPWCTYCPARPYCPAMVSFARAMLGELEADKLALEMLTPDQQGEAWNRAKLAEKLADEILKGLRAIANTDPIPLPGGTKEVRPIMSTKRSINGKRALEMLGEKGIDESELLQLMVTTKFPMFRAVKKKGIER